MKSKLPDKPSALIRVALADLRKVEKSKGYVIDMANWHNPAGGDCAVCLAGAVIAKTLKAPKTLDLTPTSGPSRKMWSREDTDKLCALNEFRGGFIDSGLEQMSIYDTHKAEKVSEKTPLFPATYEEDREGFYKDMETIASALESVGL